MYLKKILFLLKEMRNPFYFIYLLCHYLQCPLSKRNAQRIAHYNKKRYKKKGINLLWLEGYDGSAQCCHPNIVEWNGKLWLITTPYPYGIEEYENPCLFVGDSIHSLQPVEGGYPIAVPSKNGFGSHLSDPCLAVINDKLYCFYRDTINHGNCVENVILCKALNNKVTWDDAIQVLSSKEDKILSPAVIDNNHEKWMYYIGTTENPRTLKRCRLNESMKAGSAEICKCKNMPSEMSLWHIDMTKSNNGYKGVFLLRGNIDIRRFELYIACYDVIDDCWVIGDKISPPNVLKNDIAIPYKSCVLPNDAGILLSFRDKKSRYILYEAENCKGE